MEKKILRILSFLMIAIFAFGVMGLSISAEKLDIPVIEEVAEEELTEASGEEEVELYVADTTVAALYNGETLVGEYGSFSGAFSAVQNGYTIKLYKDIVGEKVADGTHVNLATSKNFTIDGQGHTWYLGDAQTFYLQTSTSVTMYNLTLKVSEAKAAGNFVVLDNGCTLTAGEGTVIRGSYGEDGAAKNVAHVLTVNPWNEKASAFIMLPGSRVENVQISLNANKNATLDMRGGEIAANGVLNAVSASAGSTVKLSGNANVLRPLAYNGAASLSFTNYSGTARLAPTSVDEFVIGTVSGEFTGNVTHNTYGCTASVAGENLEWNAAAKIGDTKYMSFVTAVNSAKNGETVNLLQDVNLTSFQKFASGQKFTIDGSDGKGGRHTVTVTHTSAEGGMYIIGTTDITIKNIRFTGMTDGSRSYGYFRLGDTAKLTMGDNSELSGTADKPIVGNNGGAVWAEGSSTFTMDGEGALIEYVVGKWHGNISGYGGGSKIYIKNGTIRNVENQNAIGSVQTNNEVYITGGSIINSKSGYGVKILAGKKLYLSGDAVITGNAAGNINAGDASAIILNGNFTGEAGVTVAGAPVIFGKVADAAYTVSGNLYLNDTTYVKAYANAEDLTLRWVSECRIGSTDYITFLQALSSVKDGETITLKDNLSYTSAVNFANGKTFTVSGDDGDGDTATKYTINIENTTKGAASVYVNAGTNVTFENINITGAQTTPHDYGFINLSGTVTIGDYCKIGGTADAYMKGTNGGLVWASGNGTFILDGEGAVVEYVQGSYWGNIALRSANSKAYIKKGTITNCKAPGYGQVTSAMDSGNDGGNIYITGGSIVNNEDSGVYIKQGAGKLELSGDAIIEGNVIKSNNTKTDIYLLNNATIVLAGDFTGRTSIIPAASAFGTLGDASYTGYENIVSAVNNQDVVLGDDGVTLKIPHEARIGNAYYWKLRDAVGKTGTIEMLADVTGWGGHMDVAARTLTINGNGHTLHTGPKAASGSQFIFVAFNNGVVNVNNVIFDCQGRPALIAHSTGGGTVTATDCTFINGTEIDNGVLAVSGGSMTLTNCTIEAGKGVAHGVIVVGTNGNAHDKGKTLTMTNCTVTGNTGNKPVVIVNGNGVATLEDVEITGNTATEGVYVAEGGKLILKGETTISGNKKNLTFDNADNITVSSGFEGNINISNGDVATGDKLAVTEAGVTLADVNAFKSDAIATLIPYIKDGAIYWTANPVLSGLTDSGIYTDGSGVIRFMTTFTSVPVTEAVTEFGTYFMSMDSFSDGVTDEELTKVVSFEIGEEGVKAPTEAGQAFFVDALASADKLDTLVQAISYVKLSGIETPVYYNYASAVSVNDAGNGTVKNLGDKA